MAEADAFLNANQEYASAFRQGDLAMPPSRKVAVVVCMDARIDPYRALGLELGEAHIIRNAGGRVADAIRSLVISQQLLGTNEIVVIHHTDCGMLTFANDDLRGICAERLGEEAAEYANATDFLPFPDVQQSVVDDVQTLRESPLIPDSVAVRGFVYDVKTGKLDEVAT